MARQKRLLSSQVIFGALVVLVGIILLADTTGLYDTRPLFDYVPSLFVLLGLYAFVKSGFRNIFGPLVIVALAGAWQLVELDMLEWSEVSAFWPLFLVLFGLFLGLFHFFFGAFLVDFACGYVLNANIGPFYTEIEIFPGFFNLGE